MGRKQTYLDSPRGALIFSGVVLSRGYLPMSDAEYFDAREQAERELARNAPSGKVRNIHQKLADKYAQLASREKSVGAGTEEASNP